MKHDSHTGVVRPEAGDAPPSGPEARRRQILDAAEACFRDKGFHGASIADISAVAGVSAGHIYYYFRNKEEIIAAIAEAELEALLEIHDSVHLERNVVEAIVARSGDIVIHYTDPQNSRLRLEILAESARNPCICARVHALDRRARESAYQSLRLANPKLTGEALEARIAAQYEVISAILFGITARAVRGIAVDHQVLKREVMDAVRCVLERG
ncbi:TetR/AcrR family transcriptional regulator [Aromatoleum evansii]|uniref:TetR/AcrR family transcriptional regulator n=1 Tax=Aromatoleum evansii TaxID=59406 RepID=UPI00145F4979|nr:TetR/AcrR family transcriptional regulator [Aromatoleum evansii]NMG30480.1 TetR family transcriptional regulator [Aromatoleum evansii]